MLIDTHCHINFKSFDKVRKNLIEETLQENIWMIMVGTQITTSTSAVEIAESYEKGVYAIIGLHPIQTMDLVVTEEADTFKTRHESFDASAYRELAKSPKVIGLGEMGLDYYWLKDLDNRSKELQIAWQKEMFEKQFKLAQELNLPIVIHCRNAHEDILTCLENWVTDANKLNGVIHSFTGNHKQAVRYVELGFMLGINGIFTYTESYYKAIKSVPQNRLIVETDCPYLTPAPLPREEQNQPKNVKYVAAKLAEVLEKTPEEIAQLTTANAKELFKI